MGAKEATLGLHYIQNQKSTWLFTLKPYDKPKGHYEKLCPQQLNYPISRIPKQLITIAMQLSYRNMTNQ
jgi:hypothetical protein